MILAMPNGRRLSHDRELVSSAPTTCDAALSYSVTASIQDRLPGVCLPSTIVVVFERILVSVHADVLLLAETLKTHNGWHYYRIIFPHRSSLR